MTTSTSVTEEELTNLVKGLKCGDVISFGFGPGVLNLKGDDSKLEELRDEEALQEVRDFSL